MSASTILSLERADVAWRMNPSRVSVVKAVGRRMVPYLIEATLIPMALFYLFFIMFELKWAIVAALVWTYAAMGRRILTGRPIPGLLVLATLGISVRTVIYVLSGNDFVYFFQPIMRTVATAAAFALSVRIGRPLVARFAADFCPISPDVQERPAVVQLFRRLTYLWAAVNAVAAAATLTLLLTVPVGCLRRHGRGFDVDPHLQRRRAHGVGLSPYGAQRRAPHRGIPQREIARLRPPCPTEVASQLVERGDVEFPSAAREDVMGRYPPSRRSANHERCHSRRAINHG